ncbi:hypothetical protein MHZ92_15035 [Sporosarcina sp. ACRSL]|uniref:hypothetical protein n=1 Tax=Sporosarcina sp. ACRSL TaxID=2918215 RepID=UPI001EF67FCE|nr:hypothetical protein [Sporosarcina sp. ACRSL]MCG7345450.1 hypothetical protein [Sporosarcina sp. ACRSL]
MIAIDRKLMNIKIKTYYLATEDIRKGDVKAHLIGYAHSLIPKSSLRSFETIQIDLRKDENELLMEMNKTTRRQIKSALERGFTHVIVDNPTDQELMDFQEFYNRFAKDKRTHMFNSYHMQTMKLLRDQNALMLTYMKDKDNNILCYRIYMTDGIVVLNLYSASHFRIVDDRELKRIMSQANRLLIWKSLLWYKEKGQLVYDMGGLTDDENIRKFKLGFGGKIVQAYSGYESKSMIGNIIMKVRDLKLKLLKGIV